MHKIEFLKSEENKKRVISVQSANGRESMETIQNR